MQDHAVAQIKLTAEKAEKEEKEHCKKEQHGHHTPEADEWSLYALKSEWAGHLH